MKSGELKLTEIYFTKSAGRFFACKSDGNIAMATSEISSAKKVTRLVKVSILLGSTNTLAQITPKGQNIDEKKDAVFACNYLIFLSDFINRQNSLGIDTLTFWLKLLF